MLQTRSRVLVVDEGREPSTARLEALDCDPLHAHRVEDALHGATSEVAVVLLDVEIDGAFELVDQLREIDRALPILVLVPAWATPESMTEAYRRGAVDVLVKPVPPVVLEAKVGVFLEMHRTRQALAAQAEAHRQTLAELDSFSYSVSHDLRAPLRAVEGFTRVIAEDYGHVLDDTAQRHLHRIAHGADRMKSIIDDLLRLAKVSRRHPVCEDVDVTALALDIATEVRAAERRKDVSVTVQPGMRVAADARLLRIALENLVRNAWKFTRDEDTPRIEIGCRHGEELFVRDNGVGFPPEQAEQIFQPFVRLHGSEFDGTGIGLSIVQRIVSHHGGTIRADSVVGLGATFSFTLDPAAASLDGPTVASVRRTSQVVQVRGQRPEPATLRANRFRS